MSNWTQAEADRVNAKNSRNKPTNPQAVATQGEGRKSGGKAERTKPKARNKVDYSKYDFVIGIDTGVNTGFCAWDIETKVILQLETFMIHEALQKVSTLKSRDYRLFVRVEDARLATHGRTAKTDQYKAQGAGSVKRDAKIWADFLVSNNIPHEMVRPAMRKKKMTAAEFKQITKWPKRTNQHSRDACMLVFGL